MEKKEDIYTGRKSTENATARAFITMDPKNNSISVHGKFYDEDCRRYFPGPSLNNIIIAPQDIAEEIKRIDKEYPKSAPSPKLAAFIASVWQKAEAEQSWFKFDDKPAPEKAEIPEHGSFYDMTGGRGKRFSW